MQFWWRYKPIEGVELYRRTWSWGRRIEVSLIEVNSYFNLYWLRIGWCDPNFYTPRRETPDWRAWGCRAQSHTGNTICHRYCLWATQRRSPHEDNAPRCAPHFNEPAKQPDSQTAIHPYSHTAIQPEGQEVSNPSSHCSGREAAETERKNKSAKEASPHWVFPEGRRSQSSHYGHLMAVAREFIQAADQLSLMQMAGRDERLPFSWNCPAKNVAA